MRYRIMALAGIAAVALALGTGAASASTTARPADGPTAACTTLWDAACQTPVVAQSLSDGPTGNFVPADDDELTYTGPDVDTGQAYGTLSLQASTDPVLTGSQDFEWLSLGTVDATRHEFGFTTFDRNEYGADSVYEVEYIPSGIDTGLCLTVSSEFRLDGLVLGTCTDNIRQAFIVTQSAPFLSAPGNAVYYYAFQAAQASNGQHHNALLDPHPESDGALAASGNAVNTVTLDEWASVG